MKNTWLILLSLAVILGCKKEPSYPVKYDHKQKNPYEIGVMENAAKALQMAEPIANYLYISMQLSDDLQSDYLSDNQIYFSATSFLTEENNKQKGIFYAIIPVNFDMQHIPFKVIQQLYIPLENEHALEMKAWELCGYEPSNVKQSFSGKITCKDPIDGTQKGLKGVQVRYRQFAKVWTAITNENGEYEMRANLLSNKPEVLLTFENELYELRNFDADNIAQLLTPYTRTLGNLAVENGIQINIGEGNHTNATLQTAATTFLSLQAYRQFSLQKNYLLPPKKLNVWISGDDVFGTGGSFAAPMLRNIGFTDINSIKQLLTGLFHLPPSLAGTLANAVKGHLPDVYAPYQASYQQGVPKYYMEALFHEFSHAGHYAKVGNSFWKPYIMHIYQNGGYGNGEQVESGLVALSESWAEDLSMQCLRYFYGSNVYTDEMLDANTNANYSWIPWGLYYDLFDVGESESWDAIEDVSFEDMYGLFSPETDSPEILKNNLNPSCS